MEMFFVFLYFFISGACVASFVNVLIDRVPQHITFVKGRSFCLTCHHPLSVFDLCPIFSYIFLKGKCRYCHTKIPVQNFILEIVGGCLSVWCFYHYGYQMMTFVSFLFSMILLVISIIDMKTMEIPDGLILSCLLLAFFSFPFLKISIIERVIGFFAVSSIMVIINLFIKNSFGGGDIKLVAVCGMMLGYQNVIMGTFLAIVIAGFYATYLMFFKQTAKQGDYIAFAPYLCFGMFFAMLYGEKIWEMYLLLFF